MYTLQIEFGAHQAVIVRTQAAKESLPDEFRDALALTIFEAKGLEFGTVIANTVHIMLLVFFSFFQ